MLSARIRPTIAQHGATVEPGRDREIIEPRRTRRLREARAQPLDGCMLVLLSDSEVPSEPVSNRTRTSTPHCATSGRPARVLGSRWEAVPVATGTLGDQPALALLQEPPRVRP